MNLSVATIEDIEATLKLHYQYQVDQIKDEDKADGFVTTAFTSEQLKALIEREQGLFIASTGEGQNKTVHGYVMAASWEFWSQWPMFAYMIQELPKLRYLQQTLSTSNSYQYGPVCIHKDHRGSGLLPSLFEFSRQHMALRFPILITFINKQNPRSFAAHTQKLNLEVIDEFQFNGNDYYELAYDTSRPLISVE